MNTLAVGNNYQPPRFGNKTNIARLNKYRNNNIHFTVTNINKERTDSIAKLIRENSLARDIYKELNEGKITIDEAARRFFQLMV